MPNEKCTQDSHKTAQDFCVGFENWGLVRTRLARARNEKKSCAMVLCAQGFKQTLGLVRTRPSHKTSHKTWEIFCTRPLCVQGPRTRLFDIFGL